jgi:hypothetical protein
MQRLVPVSAAIALALCLVLVAAPARAGDGVVLVGCDLFATDGPTVEFVQSEGVSLRNGDSNRRRFVSGSDFRSADFEGRPCAEVLSEAADEDLTFQAMDVFGEDAGRALWFFQDD